MKGYTVVLSPDPVDGGYTVSCPAMPGAVSEGVSRDKALTAAAEVMAAWLEIATEDGYGPLDETPELVAGEVAFVLGYRAEEGWDLVVETTVVKPLVAAAA
jgi:predicted RNase H-like HicB family nuclease